VDAFELLVPRRDVTVVNSAKATLDFTFAIRSGHTTPRNFEVYVVDAPMNVF